MGFVWKNTLRNVNYKLYDMFLEKAGWNAARLFSVQKSRDTADPETVNLTVYTRRSPSYNKHRLSLILIARCLL